MLPSSAANTDTVFNAGLAESDTESKTECSESNSASEPPSTNQLEMPGVEGQHGPPDGSGTTSSPINSVSDILDVKSMPASSGIDRYCTPKADETSNQSATTSSSNGMHVDMPEISPSALDASENPVMETAIEKPASSVIDSQPPDSATDSAMLTGHSISAPGIIMDTGAQGEDAAEEKAEKNANTNPLDQEKAADTQQTTTLEAPKSKAPATKRLTLQERLALAAKGRSKKTGNAEPVSSEPTSADTSTPTSPALSSSASSKIGISSPNAKRGTTESTSFLDLTAPSAYGSNNLESLQREVERLRLENRILKSQSANNASSASDEQVWVLKLAAKDETINQLMEEGKALLVKELKLYESIKKLKAQNAALEENVRDFTGKDAEKSHVLAELNGFLKANAFKSVDELLSAYRDAKKAATQTKFELDQYMSQNWQDRYQEQAQMHQQESNAKLKALKELSDFKIQLEMSRRKFELELVSKNGLISDLKSEIASIRSSSAAEISRLENKIELIRLDSETNSTGHSDMFSAGSGLDDLKSSNALNVSSARSVELHEFAKLSDAHHNLQQQYLSAQENWKLIESNLVAKVDSLTHRMETLKKASTKMATESKRLNTTLLEQAAEIAELLAEKSKLQDENRDAVFEIKMKDGEIADFTAKFEKLQTVFAQEKETFNAKIAENEEKLLDCKAKLTAQQQHPFHPQLRLPSYQSGHSQSDSPFYATRSASSNIIEQTPFIATRTPSSTLAEQPSYQNLRTPSSTILEQSSYLNLRTPGSTILEQHSPYTPHQWDDIRMGESCAKDTSSVMSDDSDPLANRSDYTEKASRSRQSSLAPRSQANSTNIHLISKMSSSIKRLEIEMLTLKDENSQLSQQKEKLETNLLESYELQGQTESLAKEIEDLKMQLTLVEKEKQTMLELIGEKSEQVEELRADVFDLKEICRSQVTQMIEMQERNV